MFYLAIYFCISNRSKPCQVSLSEMTISLNVFLHRSWGLEHLISFRLCFINHPLISTFLLSNELDVIYQQTHIRRQPFKQAYGKSKFMTQFACSIWLIDFFHFSQYSNDYNYALVYRCLSLISHRVGACPDLGSAHHFIVEYINICSTFGIPYVFLWALTKHDYSSVIALTWSLGSLQQGQFTCIAI